MEAVEAMEVEGEGLSSNRNGFKRFGLRNSFQASFGDDYVFQIVPRCDWASMAVSLSTNAVKVYSPLTAQYLGECRGHSSTVNQISFLGPNSPHMLYSCSSDSTLRAWDSRSFQQVSCIDTGPMQEVFSFSFGGAGDNLLAAGCQSQILFWDWRTMKQVACLEECHMDDVTQVHFIPGHPGKLVSASVDGLVCLFDTNGDINDDEQMLSVFNVGTSISKIGLCGDGYRKLWCLTHIETLSVWDWSDNINEANFEDARSLATANWTMDPIDYFIDCHYSEEEDHLWAIAGTNAGTFAYFPVDYRTKKIQSAESIFDGSHTGIIRSVLQMNTMNHGIFGWSGGEDGRLCCWRSDDSVEPSSSCPWVSTALVEKSPRTRMKHTPY